MLSDSERAFVARRRVARLATADHAGTPHLVPVCFVVERNALYTAIDEKPKSNQILKRVQNILENPHLSLLVDYYEEDWSQLGWVRIDGTGEILSDGIERDCAIRLLKSRYEQYRTMELSAVIAIRIRHVRSWGNLDS